MLSGHSISTCWFVALGTALRRFHNWSAQRFLVTADSRPDPSRPSCARPSRYDWAGILSGAEFFANELVQETADGSDVATIDEWLSFCDSGFPSIGRVEDIGVHRDSRADHAVWRRSRCPFCSSASEPGTYNGSIGVFGTVNLVELAGSLDRPPRGMPPLSREGSGCLPCSTQTIIGHRSSYLVSRMQENDFKKGRYDTSFEAPHAQSRSTRCRKRLPGTHGRTPRRAQWPTLPTRHPRKGRRRIWERPPRTIAAASRARLVRLNGCGHRPAERAGSVCSFALRGVGLCTGSSASWGRCAHWRHQMPVTGSGYCSVCRIAPCTSTLPWTTLRLLVGLSCASQARRNRSRNLQAQFRTLSAWSRQSRALRKSSEAIFGNQSSREAFGVARLGRQARVSRVVRTRKERPEVVIAAHEGRVRRDLSVHGEAWSDVCLLPRCGNFRSLERFVVMTAAALDEGRFGSLQRQNALLHHIYAVLELAAQDPSHEMECVLAHFRALRIQVEPALAPWVPAEHSAGAAYHKDRVALEAAHRGMGASSATASETSELIAAHTEKEVQAEFEPKCESKQVKMRQEERTRWGMNRLVTTRQSVPPNRVCPTSQRVCCQERWGILLTCHKELGKWSQFPRLLHQRPIGALAQCLARRWIPIASSRCRQRQRRAYDLKPRAYHWSAHFGWPRADPELRVPVAPSDSFLCALARASCSTSSWSRVPRRSARVEGGQARPISTDLRFHSWGCLSWESRQPSDQ